jgi:hypothetical protein
VGIHDPLVTELGPADLFFQHYLVVGFRWDRRVVPPKLLWLERRRLEEQRKAERGVDRLSAPERKEIKQEVAQRLMARALPVPRLFDCIWNLETGHVYFTGKVRAAREAFASASARPSASRRCRSSRTSPPSTSASSAARGEPSAPSSRRASSPRGAPHSRRRAPAADRSGGGPRVKEDFLAVVEQKRFLGREFLTWLVWTIEEGGGASSATATSSSCSSGTASRSPVRRPTGRG